MPIVAAVDGGDGSKAVVQEAETLADQFDEPVHIVSVYEQSEHEHLVNQGIDIDHVDSDEEKEEIARLAATDAAEAVSREFEIHGRHGNPAEEVLEFANDIDPRYIVIGGRKRSPVGKALFGSVTQSVLLDATQPVVAVMQ